MLLQRAKKNTRGFTLVELIVTLVIMALVAAVAVPTMVDYIAHTEQNARNEKARTIYMAAQDALSARMAAGTDGDLESAGPVPLSELDPALPEAERTDNAGGVVYMTAPEALETFIGDYVDQILLDGTVLVEYNSWTGQVLSAFYTEEALTLGYDAAVGCDLRERDEARLAQVRVGYYGTDSTGKYEAPLEIGALDVRLVDYVEKTESGINAGNNYGLLTLECRLPAVLEDAYNYELKLISEHGAEETIRISGGEDGVLSLSGLRNRTLEYALENPVQDGAGHDLALYMETDAEDNTWLILVVDCVDAALSITKNFPNLELGRLAASFTVSGGGDVETVYTQTENSLFGGETEAGYQVSSVRHVNNLRYLPAGSFVQTGDVLMGDIQGRPLNFKQVESFSGSYEGAGHALQNLTVSGVVQAGLFAKLGEEGRVHGLSLTYTETYMDWFRGAETDLQADYFINGIECAGGVAAVNLGEIAQCSVTGRINAGGAAGGLAGESAGSILRCYTAADVAAADFAGGIAGRVSAGTVAWCEAGTACPDGRPFFGAAYDGLSYSYPQNTKNDLVTVSATGAGAAAGGIVGWVASSGQVNYCVNACTVLAEDGHAGGVVGTAAGEVLRSYGAGLTAGSRTAGGVAGTVTGTGRLYACYNTGNVNVLTVYSAEKGGYTVSGVYDFPNIFYAAAGGIAGRLEGRASWCYNMQYAGDDIFYGAFGLALGETAHCYYLLNGLNASDLCVVDENGTKGVKQGVSGVSAERLARLEMEAIDGFGGLFDYPYPCLNPRAGDCALGARFHRTPWNMPADFRELAKISLLDEGEAGFTVDFLFKEEAADLVLRTETGTLAFSISPEERWTLLEGGAVTIGGYVFSAAPLAEDSRDYALGYSHRISCTIPWTALPEGSQTVTGYLYSYGAPAGEDWLAQSNSLPVPAAEAPVKDLVLTQDEGGNITLQIFLPEGTRITNVKLTLHYADGSTQDVQIRKQDFDNILKTDSRTWAILAAGRLHLVGDSGWENRYPFYQKDHSSREGYDEYVLLLNFDRLFTQSGLENGEFYATFEYDQNTLTSDSVQGRTE